MMNEQRAFDLWLADKCPSGDAESVQKQQWLDSDERHDFAASAYDELLLEAAGLQRACDEQEVEIHKMVNRTANAENQLAEALKQRDELLTALEALDECYCEAGNELSRAERAHHRDVLTDVRAAIAKAKGGAA